MIGWDEVLSIDFVVSLYARMATSFFIYDMIILFGGANKFRKFVHLVHQYVTTGFIAIGEGNNDLWYCTYKIEPPHKWSKLEIVEERQYAIYMVR